ncbi:MAG: DUF3108 domain-containing protein [Myxococcales bacterium]|nr:DUF3108 domain-containing protein [Myxococcales bacterium]MCB9567900.1 DUF3108 domain-containing protein [Myxococcales bacterium]MCB9700345.1 DUF3108 domain-containing protein [Myxococcales bacterium]
MSERTTQGVTQGDAARRPGLRACGRRGPLRTLLGLGLGPLLVGLIGGFVGLEAPQAIGAEPAADAGQAKETPRIKPTKPPRGAPKPRSPGRRQEQGVPATVAAPDLAKLPRVADPPVVPGLAPSFAGITGLVGPAIGWSGSLAEPAFDDRRRRFPQASRPAPFGGTLKAGERFRYDVTFGGNPTGIAEAQVAAREPGEFGAPDRLRLEGFARTSGVVSLLTTLTYEITTWIDAETGAPIDHQAVTKRSGMGRSRRREVETSYLGRGQVEIVDTRIAEKTSSTTIRRRIPVDTFDALGIMAWVRALDLEAGERARAYGLDGKVLLRVDVVGKGKSRLDPMPSIGTAIGLKSDDVYELEGSITRVDSQGVPIPGKKAYKLRVWVSSDGRRIPLVLESDVWLGVVRLILNQYDPPVSGEAGTSAPGDAP